MRVNNLISTDVSKPYDAKQMGSKRQPDFTRAAWAKNYS